MAARYTGAGACQPSANGSGRIFAYTGKGGLRFEDRPFVVMGGCACVELGSAPR